MKKLFLLLLSFLPIGALAEEPLLLINPARETFLNFPSAILPNKTVTVFLPEPTVPLHRAYPVIYILGAIAKDAAAAQEVITRAEQKAILVGINTTEKDLQDPAKLANFFVQELVPYIEANYPTLPSSALRAVVAQGKEGLQAAAVLLAQRNLFARAVLVHTGTQPVALSGIDPQLRIWIEGTRSEIVPLQQTLEELGRRYGPDFVTHLAEPTDQAVWQAIEPDYLFAPVEQVRVNKIKGYLLGISLPLEAQAAQPITWKARLANKMLVDLIPLSLRITPPYLSWDALTGQVSVVSGAVPGKVKISVSVDKITWKGKISLKK